MAKTKQDDDLLFVYAPKTEDEQRRAFVVEMFAHSEEHGLVHLMDMVDKWLKDGTLPPEKPKQKPKLQLISTDDGGGRK